MDAYKVWSMSCDKRHSNYRMEYETRVTANSRDEALKLVKNQYQRSSGDTSARGINWMVTKLP
ncbi:MAG: hypothetical protein KTR33_12695 [Gammaproteobacteria bacterium]|nr:hypothetical protein [Gammaproteobacteria bacterium]